jgi:hypothetical protein
MVTLYAISNLEDCIGCVVIAVIVRIFKVLLLFEFGSRVVVDRFLVFFFETCFEVENGIGICESGMKAGR